MTLLLDLGNTRLKWCRMTPEGALGPVQAAPWSAADPCAALRAGLAAAPASRAWALCVTAPARLDAVRAALGAVPLELARTRADCLGLRVAYAEPARLGVDRFLAMLAAMDVAPGPWLVACCGTALTLDAVAADGRHLGGLISASPDLMRAALTAAAPHLADGGAADRVFADTTADALVSGTTRAAADLVQASRARAEAAFGRRPSLLLCGGGAAALRPLLDADVHWQPDLVLQGLARYIRHVERHAAYNAGA